MKTTRCALAVATLILLAGCTGPGTPRFGDVPDDTVWGEPQGIQTPNPPIEQPLAPEVVSQWVCVYSPTYDDDWHNDVECRDGVNTRFTLLLGDLLYSNLRADRWAHPLAQRGIEQALRLRTDQHRVVDIQGAQMQHAWLHCPAAPMDQRPGHRNLTRDESEAIDRERMIHMVENAPVAHPAA